MSWTEAKIELNDLIAELRSVYKDLPSFHSDSLKGWDAEPTYSACAHLRSAIAALKEQRMVARRCVKPQPPV